MANPSRILNQVTGGKWGCLPESTRMKFEPRFEGLALPKGREERESLISEWSRIFGKTKASRLLREHGDYISSSTENLAFASTTILPPIERGIESFTRCVVLPVEPESRLRYMRFLAREELELDTFLSIAPFFAGSREVSFEPVKPGRGPEILGLRADGSLDAIKRLIGVMADVMLEFFTKEQSLLRNISISDDSEYIANSAICAARFICPNTALIRAAAQHSSFFSRMADMDDFEIDLMLMDPYFADEDSVRSALQEEGLYLFRGKPYLFTSQFAFAGFNGFVMSDSSLLDTVNASGMTVEGRDILLPHENRSGTLQHELQHIFDYMASPRGRDYSLEYRAYLAAIAFGPGIAEFDRVARGKDEIVRKITSLPENSGKRVDCHFVALSRIDRELSSAASSDDADAAVRAKAMRLLNASYKRSIGITYDQIMQPFTDPCG